MEANSLKETVCLPTKINLGVLTCVKNSHLSEKYSLPQQTKTQGKQHFVERIPEQIPHTNHAQS